MTPPQDIKPTKRFFIWETFRRAWDIVWENKGKLIVLQIVIGLLFFCLQMLIELAFPSGKTAPWFSIFINNILGFLLACVLGVGVTTLALRFADLLPVSFRDFFSKMTPSIILNYILGSILFAICFSIGFLCFIIPGFILLTRFVFLPYLVVDKEKGPVMALEDSWNLVAGVSWRVFGFLLASILLAAIPLALFAGLFSLLYFATNGTLGSLIVAFLFLWGLSLFIYPTLYIASALLYRTLWTQTNSILLAQETPKES